MKSKQLSNISSAVPVKIHRPRITPGATTRVKLSCGNLYVTVTRHEGEIFDVFAALGKSGGCAAANMMALTTAITMGIRYGVDPQVYVDKLKGIRCPSPSWDDGKEYLSCADVIARVLEQEIKKSNDLKKLLSDGNGDGDGDRKSVV